MEITTKARLGWMIGGAILNMIAAGAGALTVISIALSGFTTSQETLSTQMATLTTSLNSAGVLTDQKLAEARGNLTTEIANLSSVIRNLDGSLGTRLTENSAQLASLNATLEGMDKRLTETIARTERVEGILLKQRVFFSPPAEFSDGKFADLWMKAGYDVSPLVKFDEVSALKEWTERAIQTMDIKP